MSIYVPLAVYMLDPIVYDPPKQIVIFDVLVVDGLIVKLRVAVLSHPLELVVKYV